MKIRINWGSGILITIFIIVAGLGFLVSIAVRQDFDLVDRDYYQKGVNYQQHIDKVKNAASLSGRISISEEGKSIIVRFPSELKGHLLKGNILFYSPVASGKDYTTPINLNDSLTQVIDLKNLQPGRYTVKIDWNIDSAGYYQESDLIVK